jgi:hypothetical protein
MTRTSLLQGTTLWKDAITTNLWPYALRKACDDMNKVPHHTKTGPPLEIFSDVHMLPDIQNNHPFGCPVFVFLEKAGKWDIRSHMDIYLGPSLYHTGNVSLILSLTTSLVSPSCNTKYDDNVVTVSSSFGNYVPRSQWRAKCGFRVDPNVPFLRIPSDQSTTTTTNTNTQHPHDQNIRVSEGESLDQTSIDPNHFPNTHESQNTHQSQNTSNTCNTFDFQSSEGGSSHDSSNH